MKTDAELLEIVVRRGFGYKRAVAALYDKYRIPILRFFRGFVSKEDAEDLLHENFLMIISRASSIKNPSASTAWIWQVTRNSLYKFLRTQNLKSRRIYSGDIEEILFKDRGEDKTIDSGADTFRRDGLTPLADITGACAGGNAASRVAESCVSENLLRFREVHPDRYFVLAEALEGSSVADIAVKIGRSLDATYRYMTESRKKLVPFIEPCRKFLSNDEAVA